MAREGKLPTVPVAQPASSTGYFVIGLCVLLVVTGMMVTGIAPEFLRAWFG